MTNQYNYPNLIPSGTVLNTNLTSKAMQIQNAVFYCLQLVWTGTPIGVFSLQASADNSATKTAAGQFPYEPTNWTTVATESVSAAGSYMWNIEWAGYSFLRFTYTDGSSGTSTAVLTVSTLNVKG